MSSSSSSSVLPTQFQFQFLETEPSPPTTLIVQGAEAHLYRSHYLSPSTPAALKVRPSKVYRHPVLDARLTKQRVLQEARVMVKLRREVGRIVPAVYALEWDGGGSGSGSAGLGMEEANGTRKTCWMLMEWIEGGSVRDVLNERLKLRAAAPAVVEGGMEMEMEMQEKEEGKEKEVLLDEKLRDLMTRVGIAVGKMHRAGVVHGDLTTSNLMLRRPRTDGPSRSGAGSEDASSSSSSLDGDVVLIDFGLASQNAQDEDRAVDLYVLERAFGSTHPRTEELFRDVLKTYEASYKGAKVVLKRLEEVRMRGRKRSMVG